MIKGARQRSEQRLGAWRGWRISITQCDLRRTIQVSGSARKYLITPMESGESKAASSSNQSASGWGERSFTAR